MTCIHKGLHHATLYECDEDPSEQVTFLRDDFEKFAYMETLDKEFWESDAAKYLQRSAAPC